MNALIVLTCRALPARETGFALWAFCRFAFTFRWDNPCNWNDG